MDDAWIGEPTFWFVKEGVIRSEALRGWEGAEQHLFFVHKLFVLTGGLFVSLLGFNVYALKLVSAVYLGLLLLSWGWYFHKKNLPTSSFLFFLLLVSINSFFFEYSFIYRPELALAFFASWTFFFLEEKEPKWSAVLLAGVSAAFALGNHLNGMIIAGAGCVLLLYHRQYWQFLVFGMIAACGFGFYFYDIRSMDDLRLMVTQFSNMQDMRDKPGALDFLLRFVHEQKRYLHSPREISITLLFLIPFVIGFKNFYARFSSMVVFMLGMMFCLALVAHGKTSKYLLLHLIFMMFFASLFIYENFRQHKKKLVVVLALYGFFQMEKNFGNAFTKDNTFLADQLVGDLPAGSKILAPMHMAFWAWDRYRMQATEVYDVYQMKGDTSQGQDLILKKIADTEIDVILLSARMRDLFGIKGAQFGPYHKVGSSQELGLEVFAVIDHE